MNLNPLPLNNTGTTSIVADKHKEEYWFEDTEEAVKEFLLLDFTYLDNKLNIYREEKLKRHNNDDTIEDGYINEMEEKIRISLLHSSKIKKERIYQSRIKHPIKRLVENIMFKYNLIRDDVDIKTQQDDCTSHVFDKFHKFDPEQNTKSFSYFGTIAKHYMQNKKKESYLLKKKSLNYEDYRDHVDEMHYYVLEEAPKDNGILQLFHHMIGVFEKNVNNKVFNENDKRLLNAIIEIFKEHDERSFDDMGAEENLRSEESLIGNKYEKSEILNIVSDRAKLTKEETSKSLIKLKNLYREKKKDFLKKK